MTEAQATPGPSDAATFWGVVWLVGVALLGLILLLTGLAGRPPERNALARVDHVGPLSHTMPLVTYTRGKRKGTYRTQKIPLTVPGHGFFEVTPPPTLWIDDIDNLRSGQRVQFLIDPGTRMVFEATSGDRTLLAYADSLANRRRRSTGLIVAGLFCIGVAGLHAFSLRKAV
ncbi:MAG: hypothetical protein K2X45_07795 [Phreatobacter sp.]|nr:hypothetical protein [Phreatobacter sp.]